MRRLANHRSLVVTMACAIALPLFLSAQDGNQPTLPAKFGLEKRWETFLSRPMTPQTVATILKEDPTGGQMIRWGDARFTSVWAAVQRKVAEDQKVAALLREAQEREAPALVDEAGEDVDKLTVVARRFPWADSVHKGLLEAGARELRRGHVHLAWRCFHDALTRSEDADVRARAQVGLWLAATSDPNNGALDVAFKGVDPRAEFPWRGEKLSAEEIRRRLAPKESPAIELKDLERKALEIPGPASWVVERPAVDAQGVVIAGPNAMSWFDGTQAKPKWTRAFPTAAGKELWGPLVPGAFQPALAGGRIFARWGIQPQSASGGPSVLSHVAAFDARTGIQLWTTAANPDWQDLCPMNDPTFAEGRLYLLTASPSKETTPIYLTCLAADSGAILWKRELANHSMALTEGGGGKPPRFPRAGTNVSHQGNAVTVARGSVYCMTNMGVVACCDARDGLIEWMRTYPQGKGAAALGRAGSSPLLVGERVLFLPRDAAIAFALDAGNGEFAWLKNDDATLHIVGTTNNLILLAAAQAVKAVRPDTGEVEWERPFGEAIDGRTLLSGSTILAATKTRLHRLDAKTGRVSEEDDWRENGGFTALALRERTLYGLTVGETVRPVKPGVGPVLAGKTMRIIHRSLQSPQVDGYTTEWDKFQTVAWEGLGDVKGKAMLAHDDRNLYIGLSASGGESGDSQLEVNLSVDGRPFRWTVTTDGQGGAVWEGVGNPVPAGARAAMHSHLLDASVTFELAIPLAGLAAPVSEPKPVNPRPFPKPIDPKKVEPLASDPKTVGWGRIGVELTLRGQDAKATSLVRLSEKTFLHRLTQEQETVGLKAARVLIDMDASWQFLEQSWHCRAADTATVADFYRDFIKTEPKSPAVGLALVRLDRVLRKDLDSNPSNEILKFATEAGVSEPVRTWYKRVATSYLSQWVFVDTDYEPQAVEIELYDGLSRDHRVTAVKGGAGKGGAKSAALGKRTNRNTFYADGLPLPSKAKTIPALLDGFWDHVRIPLIWMDMHDRPIHGIGFNQTGGSHIYWDRTVLVVDGKEIVLLEDDLAGNFGLGAWQWGTTRVKKGKQSHTTPHPEFKNEDVRHTVTLKQSVRDHILPMPKDQPVPADQVISAERILALAYEGLPLLPFDDFSASLFDRADLVLRSNPEARVKLCKAILQSAHGDDVLQWLELLLRMESASGSARPLETVQELIKECGLPESVSKEFVNRPRQVLVRDWQVVGPFAPTDSVEGRPALETAEIDIEQRYKGMNGRVGWKLLETKTGRVDLKGLFDKDKSGTAFAACWVHSETKQSALLKVTSDDRVQAWVNTHIAIDEGFFRASGYAQSSGQVELSAGWNEVMVMVDSRSGRWAFSLELREKDDSRPLEGVRAQAQPPKKEKEKDN